MTIAYVASLSCLIVKRSSPASDSGLQREPFISCLILPHDCNMLPSCMHKRKVCTLPSDACKRSTSPTSADMLAWSHTVIDFPQSVKGRVGNACPTSSSALLSSNAVVFESMAFALIFLLSLAYTLQAEESFESIKEFVSLHV